MADINTNTIRTGTDGGGSPSALKLSTSGEKGKITVMQSINFEFLRKHADWQPPADLGGFGESYAHADPVAAVVKLRSFGEVLVGWIYDALKLPKPFRAKFNDLLVNDAFQAVAPRVVLAKLHAIRKEGNRAAHGETIDAQTSLWLLKESFDLGCWLHLSYRGGSKDEFPAYREPAKEAGAGMTPAMKRAYLEKIATQEAQMQQLLAELEATRVKAREAEGTVAELQVRQQALAAGTEAADVLSFDEATTRRLLIDAMLGEAGWNVGKNKTNTAEVRQELEVPHQPTVSEIGYADYGLFGEDDKPLAVVEAKKSAVDPEAGRTQAKIYADGLEKQYGVRPFIYYTNGYDIWFWNDAAKEPPRKVYGFHSKDGLQYRRFQLKEREPRSKVAPSGEIVTRLYQFEAMKSITAKLRQLTGTTIDGADLVHHAFGDKHGPPLLVIIACELAHMFLGSGDVPQLSAQLSAVLEPPTLQKARRKLSRLGFPVIELVEEEPIVDSTISSFGQSDTGKDQHDQQVLPANMISSGPPTAEVRNPPTPSRHGSFVHEADDSSKSHAKEFSTADTHRTPPRIPFGQSDTGEANRQETPNAFPAQSSANQNREAASQGSTPIEINDGEFSGFDDDMLFIEELVNRKSGSDRRHDKVSAESDLADRRRSELVWRQQRVNRISKGDVEYYLRNYYSRDGHLYCQMRHVDESDLHRMPFRKKDGEEWWVRIELLNGKWAQNLTYELPEYKSLFVVLCPNCAALYTEFVRNLDAQQDELFKWFATTNETEFLIKCSLNGRQADRVLHFDPKHLSDIRAVKGIKAT